MTTVEPDGGSATPATPATDSSQMPSTLPALRTTAIPGDADYETPLDNPQRLFQEKNAGARPQIPSTTHDRLTEAETTAEAAKHLERLKSEGLVVYSTEKQGHVWHTLAANTKNTNIEGSQR